MKEQITWAIVAILYLATLYTLVKPGSTGTQLVSNVTGTLADLVRGVSGQTYNASTQKWSTANG
jgi:hypothetical protein